MMRKVWAYGLMLVSLVILTIQAERNLRLESNRMNRLGEKVVSGKGWRQEQKDKLNRKQNQQKTVKMVQKLRDLNEYAASLLGSSFSHLNKTFSYDVHSSLTPTTVDLTPNSRCTFLGAHCPTEAIEHDLVRRFIKKDDTVLELGGRFGTTSCEIAKVQGNSGELVTVEPDSAVWHLLAYNRRSNNCNFWIYRGVVSDQPSSTVRVVSASYDTRTISAPINPNEQQVRNSSGLLPSFTLQQLQDHFKMRFSVLLIDCEGCINQLFRPPPNHNDDPKAVREQLKSLKQDLKSVSTIIIEADMSNRSPTCFENCVDYQKWFAFLRLAGFRIVVSIPDPDFSDINHYVLKSSNHSSLSVT